MTPPGSRGGNARLTDRDLMDWTAGVRGTVERGSRRQVEERWLCLVGTLRKASAAAAAASVQRHGVAPIRR